MVVNDIDRVKKESRAEIESTFEKSCATLIICIAGWKKGKEGRRKRYVVDHTEEKLNAEEKGRDESWPGKTVAKLRFCWAQLQIQFCAPANLHGAHDSSRSRNF